MCWYECSHVNTDIVKPWNVRAAAAIPGDAWARYDTFLHLLMLSASAFLLFFMFVPLFLLRSLLKIQSKWRPFSTLSCVHSMLCKFPVISKGPTHDSPCCKRTPKVSQNIPKPYHISTWYCSSLSVFVVRDIQNSGGQEIYLAFQASHRVCDTNHRILLYKKPRCPSRVLWMQVPQVPLKVHQSCRWMKDPRWHEGLPDGNLQWKKNSCL